MKSEEMISYIVASDVHLRDGIGLETYINGSLVMDIFRDDSEKRTYVTVYSKNIDLAHLEASVTKFKEKIDAAYID